MFLEVDDDQRMIQASVRRFVEVEVLPKARAADAAEAPVEAWLTGLGALGMMGMFVDPAHGGTGLDLVSAAMAVEEIARGDGALAVTIALHNALALGHLARAGDATRARLLPALVTGAKLAAWAGPLSGGALRVSAEKIEGRWRLSGSASLTWLGATGDPLIVVAQGPAGPTAFAIEGAPSGLARRTVTGKLGLRAADAAELVFDGLLVSDAARLGAEGQALAEVGDARDRAQVLLGAVAVGLGRAALEASLAYAQERRQFGRAIADFQAIQWMLADMGTELDAARLLVLSAAEREGAERSRAAAQAKVFAAEAASRAGTKAIQIHGGNGFVRELPVERILRDAKTLEVALFPSDPARAEIARSLLG